MIVRSSWQYFLVILGFINSSRRIAAFTFFPAGVLPSRGRTFLGAHDTRDSSPGRIIILPDSRAKVSEDMDLWHHHLKVCTLD